MRINYILAAFLLALTVSISSAKVLLKQNFDTIQPGPLSGSEGLRVYKDGVDDFSIVTSPVVSAPNALKVLRQTSPGSAVVCYGASDGYDYALEFKCLLEPSDGVVIHLLRDGSNPQAGILLQASLSPSAYNSTMGWQKEEKIPALPENQWFTCRIAMNFSEKNYKLSIVFPDGTERAGAMEFPYLIDGVCNEMRFINILPAGCHSFIDDVIITQADAPALAGRTCHNGIASSPDAALTNALQGTDGAEYHATPGTSAVIEFAPEAEINAIQVASADGALLPKVTVKALNLLGHWVALGQDMSFDDNGFLLLPPTQKVCKLTLDFATDAVLSSLRVYSPPSAGQAALDKAWVEKLDAEYRLPVYDMQYPGHDRAEFTFVNHTDAPLKAIVSLQERATKVDYGSREIEIQPGRSSIYYNVAELPNGEYVTTVADNSNPTAEKHGRFERLLRHRTSPQCAATPRVDMDGQKMFFPDGFFLSEYKDIDFTPGIAERHLVHHGTPGNNDEFINYADTLFLDNDGNVCINFHTQDRLWHLSSTKSFHAIAKNGSLDEWEIGEGALPVPAQVNPLTSAIPAAATPDWNEKPGPDGNITYRFYDPEKDGPVNLNQINCDMVSPSAPGTAGYKKYDWKVMTPAPCTIWPIWYKSPGEAIILTHTPLVDTFPPSGTLEPPNSGSDLGFGQWLEDDGKTFCMGHGRHLIRSMPYIARYDNLFDRARITAVWRTRDGINWEQNYVGVPSDNKPLADQQYGGTNFRVPYGAGLRIAFLNRYSAYTQQISWEIIYTWDGFRWTRYQDKPQFMPNGPLGDWFHGGGYVSTAAVERDGKFIQLMHWVNDHCHFQSEIVHSSFETADGFTADYMKRRYSPRHLEDWPFFQEHFGGSWEKLAEHTRNSTSGFGVAVYRKDGFFSADADDTIARMLTKPVTAHGGLKMNAIVNDGGFVEVKILQDGEAVAGYSKKLEACDGVELPLFDSLPEGEFQVELTLKNARIYTLQF